MNIFRLLGDFSHLAAIIILLIKIWKTRSCAGKYFFSIFNSSLV
jgi:ER lumen protein retaining receptor